MQEKGNYVWEDGKEKVNYSQKKLLFSKESDNSPEYIAGTKAHIILDWDGEMTEYNRQDKKFAKLKYNHKQVISVWGRQIVL